MQFFVNTKNTTRLYPWGEADGHREHWIEVKNDLSAKEEQDVRAAGIPHVLQRPQGDGETPEMVKGREVKMGLDMGRMALVRAKSYIVRWSLTDPDGHPVPVNEAAIGEHLPDVFDAIERAIDAHKGVQAAKKAEAQAGQNSQKSA